MATKVRIVIAGSGALAGAIAGALGALSATIERPDISDHSPRDADVLVLAGDGPVEGMLELANGVRQKSPNVAIVVAAEASEGLVQTIARDVGPLPLILGVGTVAHTRRFRDLIARRCRVASEEVHAFVVGRSDGVLVPLWSTAAIGAVPLHHWAVAGHGKLGVRDRVEIFQTAKEPLPLEEKVAAAVEVVEAIVNDGGRVLSVCAVLKEYAGMKGVCLSVPHVVNRSGAEVPANIPLNPAEEAGLRQAGEQPA